MAHDNTEIHTYTISKTKLHIEQMTEKWHIVHTLDLLLSFFFLLSSKPSLLAIS